MEKGERGWEREKEMKKHGFNKLSYGDGDIFAFA